MPDLYTSGTINIPNVTGNIVITAVATPGVVTSLSAVFNQGTAVIYDTDSLDTLRQYLTVTASYSTGSSAVVSGYTLSGTLTEGTSTVTVTYGGKTTTFNVVVSATYVSIHNSPMSWGSNSQNAFSYSNGVMTIMGSGTSSYPGGALKGLKYTYNQIHDKRVRLSCKVTLTGDVTSGSGLLLGANLYTSANPANNGSSVRFDGHTVRTSTTSGTVTFSEEFIWDELWDVPVDAHKSYYFGVSIMLNSPSGITATIEDMSFEAVM